MPKLVFKMPKIVLKFYEIDPRSFYGNIDARMKRPKLRMFNQQLDRLLLQTGLSSYQSTSTNHVFFES